MFMSIPFVYRDQCPYRNKYLTNTSRLNNLVDTIKNMLPSSLTGSSADKQSKNDHHGGHHHHHHQQHYHSSSNDVQHCRSNTDADIGQENIKREGDTINSENIEDNTSSQSSVKSLDSTK